MFEVLTSLALGAAGALALWGLYRALELNWPEQYVSLNDTFALRVTQTWWRFLVYRFVPLFVAGIGIWATTERLSGVPVLAVCTMALIHVAHTNLLALFESFGKLQRHRKFTINYASYHLLIIVIITAATLSSCVLGPSLSFLVPSPGTLLENLWIAVFIAIAGGIAVAVIGRRPTDANGFDSDYFVWRAKRDVDIELIDWAFEVAIENRSDPILLRSIMFAEALQRPKWVRAVERVKGLLFGKGSYGVTQEHADHPISDRESIARTGRALSNSWALAQDEWGWHPHDGLIWKFAAKHNEDVPFIQGVQKIYRIVHQDSALATYGAFHAALHLIEIRRYPQEFGLRGVTSALSLEFAYEPFAGAGGNKTFGRPSDCAEGGLWSFEMRFPVDIDALNVDLTMPFERSSFAIPIHFAHS